MNITPVESQNNLFIAQKAAMSSVDSHYFPYYRDAGNLGASLCNTIHLSFSALQSYVNYLANLISNYASSFFERLSPESQENLNKLKNACYPINPINGNRHLVPVSRKVEKFLGDNIFFPLSTFGGNTTHQRFDDGTRMKDVVDKVVSQLVSSNGDLLNPPGTVPFEYKAQTVSYPEWNAFALPGGKIVVFSTLLEEINYSLTNKDIQHSEVRFEDGSLATVDLSEVTLTDVIACLIAHEMTHSASRHSLTFSIGGFSRALMHLVGMDSIWSNLSSLLESRNHEFEADATGAYLAWKAGYNPRGALYFLELFHSAQSPQVHEMFKLLEPLLAHPYGEKRMRACLTAISAFAPENLQNKVSWKNPTTCVYNPAHVSPAVLAANAVRRQLGQEECDLSALPAPTYVPNTSSEKLSDLWTFRKEAMVSSSLA